MARVYAAEIGKHVGERVQLAGWVHNVRLLGKVNFLVLRDASGTCQALLSRAEAGQLEGILPESVVEVEGLVCAEAQAPGGVEVHEPRVTALVRVAEGLPFPINKPEIEAHLDTFLDHAPVGLRHLKKRAIFRLAAGLMAGFRAHLAGQRFVEITTPKIVASATEGGANVFAIDYLGRPAYLAQSPQFYKQTMVGVFERVFEVGPVFRAEPHETVRHVNEYVSLDAEMGFIKDHTTVMATLNKVIAGMVGAVREKAGEAVAALKVSLPDVPASIPSIHFADSQELILKETGEDMRSEPDFAPNHEKFLGDWAKREYGSDFLFVYGYPLSKRPFYTHPDPDRPGYSRGFDLLFRGLELVTGGQRLHLYQDYLDVLKARGMDPEPYLGYLEAFKYGMPPHGGFAIGLERFVLRLIEGANIRETTLFPRDINRLSP